MIFTRDAGWIMVGAYNHFFSRDQSKSLCGLISNTIEPTSISLPIHVRVCKRCLKHCKDMHLTKSEKVLKKQLT